MVLHYPGTNTDKQIKYHCTTDIDLAVNMVIGFKDEFQMNEIMVFYVKLTPSGSLIGSNRQINRNRRRPKDNS
mgnify:CR=1 FL=1